jgi:hypothetical protein
LAFDPDAITGCLYCGRLIRHCEMDEECKFAGWVHQGNRSHYCDGKKNGTYLRVARPRPPKTGKTAGDLIRPAT